MKRLVLAALLVSGCDTTALSQGPESLFDLTLLVPPAAGVVTDFYALPYPNDLRLDPDGTPALAGYPKPDPLPQLFLPTIDAHARGFGATQAVYFRFLGAIDPTKLPLPAATVADGASVFLVDVTEGSAHRGEKVPVQCKLDATAGDYIGANSLAVLPVPGFPPREGETYAAIVTDTVGARPAPALDRVLHGVPHGEYEERATTVYEPLVTWLAEQPAAADGKPYLEHVAAATVYTTNVGSPLMDGLRTAVLATPVPVVGSLAHDVAKSTAAFDLFTGVYDSPNFQSGAAPYTTSGGEIEYDESGAPIVVRTESLRVAMTIPKGTMPPAGWPVIVYAAGTGGDYETFVDDGTAGRFASVTASDGTVLASFAVISIDPVLSGTRVPAGTNAATSFFNVQNLLASRDNPKQGALDDFQLVRLVQTLDIASAPDTGQPIAFDPQRHYFFGHSEGSLTGALFVGSEPALGGAIFSGAGADLVLTLLEKQRPVDTGALLVGEFRDPVDAFHPFMNLMAGFFDESDPATYTRRFFREPPTGVAPKSVFVSLGLGDSYVPDASIAVFALGAGVVPVNPALYPLPDLGLPAPAFANAPQSRNVAGGQTGVLCEYTPAPNEDGHFVLFDVAEAEAQSTRFLGTLSATGVATLDPP